MWIIASYATDRRAERGASAGLGDHKQGGWFVRLVGQRGRAERRQVYCYCQVSRDQWGRKKLEKLCQSRRGQWSNFYILSIGVKHSIALSFFHVTRIRCAALSRQNIKSNQKWPFDKIVHASLHQSNNFCWPNSNQTIHRLQIMPKTVTNQLLCGSWIGAKPSNGALCFRFDWYSPFHHCWLFFSIFLSFTLIFFDWWIYILLF